MKYTHALYPLNQFTAKVQIFVHLTISLGMP